MSHVFKSRSLTIINDLSIEERKYFFTKVKELKQAIVSDDKAKMDEFRINDPDFGMYEVFLEDSTRTKESFRNAAKFHHAKVNELLTDHSSINKGESYSDTFNMLSGYHNSVFIIRSKVEGLCKHLSDSCGAYAERNHLPCKPAFINAGDGKHEHPTQELLDEFTILEDNNWSYENLHIAMVGDLFHGRTINSKANGLTIFKHVEVDLIAPKELEMQEAYLQKMKDNGFIIRQFASIDAYLSSSKIAKLWYFTRPQLERMGERILQKQDELREAITFKPEFLSRIPEGCKFYHPLPRHKMFPTIPTFLDNTPMNAWERQAINGMYVRIVLLGLIGGKIGSDFQPKEEDCNSYHDEEYIFQVPEEACNTKAKKYGEGVHPIQNGLVIDHICHGETPSEIRSHMGLISKVIKLDNDKGGEWVSESSDHQFKGIIFRPGNKEFSRKEMKRLAAVAPGCTLNIIKDGRVKSKYRTKMPPRIYNFDDLGCKNEQCISSAKMGEKVPAMFYRSTDNKYVCAYCGEAHSFKEIWGN